MPGSHAPSGLTSRRDQPQVAGEDPLIPNKGKIVAHGEVVITPVSGKAEREAFVDLAYRINADDPNWVPPSRMEASESVDPAKNPFFGHADVQFFSARRDGRVVGRISAHLDHSASAMDPEQGMGPGIGNWGSSEAEDGDVARASIATAEDWSRGKGMTRVSAPSSMSVWEEPGQLTRGHEHPPTVTMGHQPKRHQTNIEAQGYTPAKKVNT
ncbi:hypothetical protein OY671_007615, partial [Metschnikowia pulcherrima]